MSSAILRKTFKEIGNAGSFARHDLFNTRSTVSGNVDALATVSHSVLAEQKERVEARMGQGGEVMCLYWEMDATPQDVCLTSPTAIGLLKDVGTSGVKGNRNLSGTQEVFAQRGIIQAMVDDDNSTS